MVRVLRIMYVIPYFYRLQAVRIHCIHIMSHHTDLCHGKSGTTTILL